MREARDGEEEEGPDMDQSAMEMEMEQMEEMEQLRQELRGECLGRDPVNPDKCTCGEYLWWDICPTPPF